MTNEFYNLEAEQTILGSAIMNSQTLGQVADILEPKHFFFEENKVIFERFVELGVQGKTLDQVTIRDLFVHNKFIVASGGKKYLSTILSQASGVINLRDYGFLIIELWQKRQLVDLLQRTIEDANSKSFNSLSANLENELNGLATQEPKKKTQTMNEIIADIEEEEKVGISSKYTPTGFQKLDDLLNGGIYSKQMVIIGARPSVGKTSIGQNIILTASQSGKKCLFISLEVDKRSVYTKFMSNLASVNGWKMQKNILSDSEKQSITHYKKELKDLNICVNDSSFLKVSQIKRIIKNQIEKQALDLVVVDYVQIIKGDDTKGKNEASIIKEITSSLKSIAKQYDVGILALAQINRKATEGPKQEPTINDFKSSGGIEEDADVAIILHRDRNEESSEGYFSNGGKLIVAKNRYGRTGEVPVLFEGQFGRFQEIEKF